MKRAVLSIALLSTLFFLGCRSEINYSKSLFQHIPDDPELLVLVRPNDLAAVADTAVNELKIPELLGTELQIDTKDIEQYSGMAIKMMEALGIPWDQVESVGFLMYFEKPVILVSGKFKQLDVTAKMSELGFKQGESGYFDYIYNDFKLALPADGLIMLAEEMLLEDLESVPEENRLWNRKDFAKYRTTSPLTNSLFVWGRAPDDFMADFTHREALGDISVALDLRGAVSFSSVVRVKDPEKTIMLHNIILGSVTVGRGVFGDDPDYGPLFNGINTSHTNQEVVTGFVIPANKVDDIKKRILSDIENPESGTLGKFKEFFDKF